MKTILLMRHAKSSWDHGGLEDHDRPLNTRGIAACATMGTWLVEQDLQPDAAWVSTATRTRETWARLSAAFSAPPRPHFERDLYHSGPDRMLDVLQSTPPEATRVILIAHQPGMSAITAMLADPHEHTDLQDAARHFPTAAIVVLEAQIDTWTALQPHACQFMTFARPKALQA